MASYVPSSMHERQEMLDALGIEHIEDLFLHLPKEVLLSRPLNIPEGASEFEVMARMEAMASRNVVYPTIFRGAGAYRHFIPSCVNHLASRSEYVTAYTPYQAEMSQGLLQTIFEYQTMIAQLTGLYASNASVYDGATAAAEAMMMCRDRKREKVLIASTANVGVQEVMKTYCYSFNMPYAMVPSVDGHLDMDALKAMLDETVSCIYMEQLNYFGQIEDVAALCALAKEHKIKSIVGCNPIALALLPSPGECGADIAVGEGQPLGIPLSFGGPYLGFMSANEANFRKLPGRIVGETTDLNGKQAFVLTLQAREQHIRREKASSSICSNQSLCAVRAAIYLSVVGYNGLQSIAQRCVDHAHLLAETLCQLNGFAMKYQGEFFHEFVTVSKQPAEAILKTLADHQILGGLAIGTYEILWCATEVNTADEIQRTAALLKEAA